MKFIRAMFIILVVSMVTLFSISIGVYINGLTPISEEFITEEVEIVDKYRTFAKVSIYNIEIEGLDTGNKTRFTTNLNEYEKLEKGNAITVKYRVVKFKNGETGSTVVSIE